ncbi:MAG: YifB family Mg chelatase-like AAA ATPase [Gordonia sp. (in: high G+C Gram-positive bacteria)]|uniref:YifB family Mg chelatase-like AAA ATPase n=1 Tax=Gordonia sp. (in: high G+C Gram-positive bacteria) TaxID=84139 RepID=UPI003BB6068D
MPRIVGNVHAMGLGGFVAQPVEIQANIGQGLPGFLVTGSIDASLREAKERVRAAITNSGFKFPELKVTAALAPAELRKEGSGFDLGIALAILIASAELDLDLSKLSGTVFLGELGLDGRVRSVRGVLPLLLAARSAGFCRAVVPVANLQEASLVDDLDISGAQSLAQVVHWMLGAEELSGLVGEDVPPPLAAPDMADVVGQAEARHALEVAAAGGHHVLMTGSPGIGKTMLAARVPGILPPLEPAEALEVTAIHSVAGTLPAHHPLITVPPFIAPHHSVTMTALLGGGTGMARPGAVSRAHRGVLFLDECAEAGAKVLDGLRQPLEEGRVRLSRRDGDAVYPSRFMLLLAANPCPCAPVHDVDCVCTSVARRRYLGKLSGPLMDRIDIRVQMDPPGTTMLMTTVGESSAAIAERVAAARERARMRWRPRGWLTNSEVPGSALRRDFPLSPEALAPIEQCLRDGRITARGADRALRLSWTICDLRSGAQPEPDDVAQALMYRDREWR